MNEAIYDPKNELPKVAQQWFTKRAVRFDCRSRYQKAVYKDRTVLKARPGAIFDGLSLGPGYGDVTVVAHEMAHLVEIDDERCHMPSWGLKIPKNYEMADRYGAPSDPKTFKGSLREIRVIAIEHHICQLFGWKWDPYDYGGLLEQAMYDYCWCFEHYGVSYEETKSLSYDETKELRVKLIAEDILRRVPNYNIDDIFREWQRKVDIVESRLGKDFE